MENKQAVAVAVGVGAVGTALAYLGYSVYNDNDDTKNLVDSQNDSWFANLWTNSNTDEAELVDPDNNNNNNNNNNDKNFEMKNLKIPKTDTTQSAWGSFWKKEHTDILKEEESAENDEEEERQTTDVSDFN